MDNPKSYYAFISYNHADKKEAQNLQHWLEYYKLPTNLRKENSDLPTYVRPIFRDTTHLEIGDLSEQIKEALDQSEFLIVVCSPNAAQSEWVNKEIKYFSSIGKQDKILPYIVSGIPNSKNPQEECYPPAYKEITKGKEILGANINEAGKESAAIRVVAKMFNLRQEVLWQRHQREKKKRNVLIVSAVLTLFAFILVVAWALWHQNLALARTNWQLMEKQARLVTEEANECFKNGDVYKANILMLDILPRDFISYDRPFFSEMESVFRKSCIYHDGRLIGHADAICSAEYSPDGKYIVSASEDSTIRIWNAETGENLRTLRGHQNTVNMATFSPDGKIVASASADSTIRFWDADTGDSIFTLKGAGSPVHMLTFSPNGERLISASQDKTIRVWNAKTGESVKVLRGHLRTISSVNYSYNGKYIVSASDDHTIRIWDAETGGGIHTIPTNSSVAYAAFHPQNDSIIISAESASWTNIFNSETGVESLYPEEGVSIPLVVSGQLEMRSYKQNYTINLWNSRTGKLIYTLHDKALSVRFSPDGKYIVSASDVDNLLTRYNENSHSPKKVHNIKVWDVLTGDSLFTFYGHTQYINHIDFSPNGERLISASNDSTIRIWDFARVNRANMNGLPYWEINGTYNVTFSPHGRYFIVPDSNIINVFDTQTKKITQSFQDHKNTVTSCLFCGSENMFVTSSLDSTIRVWDINRKNCVGHICCRNEIKSLIINREETVVASFFSMNNTIYMWDLKNFKQIDSIYWTEGKINSIYFQDDGNLLISTNKNRDMYVWDCGTHKTINQVHLISTTLRPSAYAFSPNGECVACPSVGDRIAIYNVLSGDYIFSQSKHNGEIRSLNFSSDGKYLVSTSEDHTVCIWDAETGDSIRTLHGHAKSASIFYARYSPNDKYIISVASAGDTKIWDAEIGKCIFNLNYSLPINRAKAVGFSPDEKYVAVPVHKKRAVMLFLFNSLEDLVKEAKERYKYMGLTKEERKQYYLE